MSSLVEAVVVSRNIIFLKRYTAAVAFSFIDFSA